MPYKSKAQQGFFHTETAKKAGITPEQVAEFDSASKGKKLPEKAKKMAEGGMIENFMNNLRNKTEHSSIFGADERESNMAENVEQDAAKPQLNQWQQKLNDALIAKYQQPVPASDIPKMAGGGITFPKKATSGPGINIVPHEKYAEGLDPFSVDTGDSSTVKMPGIGGNLPPAGPQFNPSVGLPPTPPPPAQIAAPPPPVLPQNPVSAPVMPPTGGNPTADYLAQQKAQMAKYGPEQQLAVAQDIAKRRSSPGQVIPRAMGGLADALMQGVARAGPGKFEENIANAQNERDTGMQTAMEKAGTQNIAQTEQQMKLDAMDPKSPLSQTAQKTYGPLLARNGFKPQQIGQMPASMIASLTGTTVEALKAESEAKMAAASLALHGAEAEQVKKHQGAEESAKAIDQKREGLKEIASHGIAHPINAFRANQQLADMTLNGGGSAAAVGPYGAETTNNGKAYIWHPETGKYYLKGQ